MDGGDRKVPDHFGLYGGLGSRKSDEDISGWTKAIWFMRTRMKDPLYYSIGDQQIMETSSFKYLGIIICRDLSWAVPVNCTMQKIWKALHFILHMLKKGNSNLKS
jgi:hypothetical protein